MPRPKLYKTDYPNLRRDTPDATRTTVYYADFECAGTRIRKKLGTGFDKSKDRLLNLIRETREAAGLAGEPDAVPTTLRELQLAHLAVHTPRIKGSTLKSYVGRDKNAIEGLGDVLISSLKRAHIEAWIARRAAATSTTNANRDLTRLKQVLRWAQGHDWIPRDPSFGIRKFREVKHKKFCLSEQQEARLRECSSPRFWGMVRFALLTGLRQAEQLGLRWTHIVRGEVQLESDDTKGHKARFVPLHPDCVAILEQQRLRLGEKYDPAGLIWPNKRGRQIDRTTFRKFHWRPVFDLAGLEDQDWHRVTRHTFCSRLQRQGVHILDIAELAGHEDLRTTRGYTHAAEEKLIKAIMNQK